jgi:conjugative transfer signal peptidase TraF
MPVSETTLVHPYSGTRKTEIPMSATSAKVGKSWWDRLSYGLLALGAALCFLPVLMVTCTPYRWLTTHSLPWGIYRRTQEPIARGRLVHFCLPDHLARYALEREYIGAGFCPGAAQELVKSVAAVAGDEVEITAAGVSVNGALIPHTPVYAADSCGRSHQLWRPEGRFIVPAGQVFVLSTFHPRSWDSRYFGSLPLSVIRGTVREVWTW